MTKGPATALADLFPPALRDLLTATGKHFIQRIGPDLVRQSTLNVLLGHNVRTQTEPLTRQRIAEVSGALLAMFEKGLDLDPEFYARLSRMALAQLGARNGGARDKVWPAQWALGLTGKGLQNVLRGDAEALAAFLDTFETSISQAANSLQEKLGPLQLAVRIGHDPKADRPALGWVEALRLTTAIGCAELAVRGSDKSRYGKLFERLVLGSVLSILGFEPGGREKGAKKDRVFWLSDSSDDRECDATAIVKPGTIARFDIGFIGVGNPEIVRDKLSRFARDVERAGKVVSSTTFVIVDRYPTGPTANSLVIAKRSGTAILQMSMSLWPRELARELKSRVGYAHPLADYNDTKTQVYITKAMSKIDVMGFLRGAVETETEPTEDPT